MTVAQNDGGPAFPIPASGSDAVHNCEWGMSLRDHFAGQALSSLMANPYWVETIGRGVEGSNDASAAMNHVAAAHAYELADAMLAERAGGQS